MAEEKFDGQERARRMREAAPTQTSDALIERQQNLRKMREESTRLKAEQDERENHQKRRQARHEALARQEDDAIRAKIFARYLRAEEEARAQTQAEVRPDAVTTPRQDEELAAEQAGGRARLEKYARRNQDAAASREREEDTAPGLPGFKP